MRVLALDYGSARCGAAVSDPSGTVVTPIEAVLRADSKAGIGRIAALVRERGVGTVVVGLPLSLAGSDSAQTKQTRAFAARLATRLGEQVSVELYDERLTTKLASRDVSRDASEDSRAAAHLLEGWLARQSRGSGEDDR
jgi:putative Holliday junction resolvase